MSKIEEKNEIERVFSKTVGKYKVEKINIEGMFSSIYKNRALIHIVADGGVGKTFFVNKILKRRFPNYKFYNAKNIKSIIYEDNIILDGWDEIPIATRNEIREKIIKSDIKGILVIGRDDNQRLSTYASEVYSMETNIEGSDLPPRFYKWCDDKILENGSADTLNHRIYEITKRHFEKMKKDRQLIKFLSLVTYKMLKKGSNSIKEEDLKIDINFYNAKTKSKIKINDLEGITVSLDGWVFFDNRTVFFYFCMLFIKELSARAPEILNGLYYPILRMEKYKELAIFLSSSDAAVICTLFDANLYSLFPDNLFAKALENIKNIVSESKIFDHYINYNENTGWTRHVGHYVTEDILGIIRRDARFLEQLSNEVRNRHSCEMLNLINKFIPGSDLTEFDFMGYATRTKGNQNYLMQALYLADKDLSTKVINSFIEKYPDIKKIKSLFKWTMRENLQNIKPFLLKHLKYWDNNYYSEKWSNTLYGTIYNLEFDTKDTLMKIGDNLNRRTNLSLADDTLYFTFIYREKGFESLLNEVKQFKNNSRKEFVVNHGMLSTLREMTSSFSDDEVRYLQSIDFLPTYKKSREKSCEDLVKEVFDFNFKSNGNEYRFEYFTDKQVNEIVNNKGVYLKFYKSWKHRQHDRVSFSLYMQLNHLLGKTVSMDFIIKNFSKISRVNLDGNSSANGGWHQKAVKWADDYDWKTIQTEVMSHHEGNKDFLINHQYYLKDIFEDYFLYKKWGDWEIDDFLNCVNISNIIAFLTENKERISNPNYGKLIEWWRKYIPAYHGDNDIIKNYIDSIHYKYEAGIEINELLDEVTSEKANEIVGWLVDSIDRLSYTEYVNHTRSILPIEDYFDFENITYHFLIKIILRFKIKLMRKRIVFKSNDSVNANVYMISTILYEICKSANIDYVEFIDTKGSINIENNLYSLEKSAIEDNKYDGFIKKYFKCIESELSPKEFIRVIKDEIIPEIGERISKWGFPGETEMQNRLKIEMSMALYNSTGIKTDFEFNPYTRNASAMSVDICFSFNDMCIFIEIKDYDDPRTGAKMLTKQLQNYNTSNLFSIKKILYIFRKKPFANKLSKKTIEKIRRTKIAAQSNDFEVIAHKMINEINSVK